MGRCFGYMIANFIFTKWCVTKIVIKKMTSEITKTKLHYTMICRGPTMSICQEFVCFFLSIQYLQYKHIHVFIIQHDLSGSVIDCIILKLF